MAKSQAKPNYNTVHESGGYTDYTFTWVEGLKDDKWFPLYNFRAADHGRAVATVLFIKNKLATNQRLPDGLGEFSDFRLHELGRWMESDVSGIHVRSMVGLDNLQRILQNFNHKPTCGKVKRSTGEICTKEPNHEGKHGEGARK